MVQQHRQGHIGAHLLAVILYHFHGYPLGRSPHGRLSRWPWMLSLGLVCLPSWLSTKIYVQDCLLFVVPPCKNAGPYPRCHSLSDIPLLTPFVTGRPPFRPLDKPHLRAPNPGSCHVVIPNRYVIHVFKFQLLFVQVQQIKMFKGKGTAFVFDGFNNKTWWCRTNNVGSTKTWLVGVKGIISCVVGDGVWN